MNLYRKAKGFTLIEGIITIVLLAIAMITLISFLFPQVERSAIPYYQARSAAMGEAILNQVLARQFDQNSDPNGDSVYRCGENDQKGQFINCSAIGSNPNPVTLGPDGELEKSQPQYSNDVDDFIGCWGTKEQCQGYKDLHTIDRSKYPNTLMALIPSSDNAKYKHIFAVINVEYDRPDLVALKKQSQPQPYLKKIIVTVNAGRYGKYDYIAYKGNY